MSAALESFHGELVKMVTGNWVGRVMIGFEEALKHSFATDELIRPVITRDEMERRFHICARWFVTLRRDCGWSVPRILDELPMILRNELDGIRYEPTGEGDRQSWVKDAPGEALEIDSGDLDLTDPATGESGTVLFENEGRSIIAGER